MSKGKTVTPQMWRDFHAYDAQFGIRDVMQGALAGLRKQYGSLEVSRDVATPKRVPWPNKPSDETIVAIPGDNLTRLYVGEGVTLADAREAQARRLWQLGFGRREDARVNGLRGHRVKTWTQYLATIPTDIPAQPTEVDYLDQLVLVEGRVGLVMTCKLLSVSYGGSDSTFEPYDPKQAKTGVYWMRMQDGRRNHNVAPNTCRTQRFHGKEFGCSAHEGLATYAQDRNVIKQGEHVMDLPGSVLVGSRDRCAFLGVWVGEPRLCWGWHGDPSPGCGSASRWEV